MTDDPSIVQEAPHLAALIESAGTGPLDPDRARGVMLGHAVGNLLGLPFEFWPARRIREHYPDGIREIDPAELHRPPDDDLAQALDLAEALGSDDPAADFAERLVVWRRENGRGIGVMTSSVIDYLEAGMGAGDAARAYWRQQGSPETQPNGGLMRCAPVALTQRLAASEMLHQTALTCAVTHYAPGAQWSCVLVNAAIAILLRGGTPDRRALIDAAALDGAPASLTAWALATPDDIARRVEEETISGHTYLAMQCGLWCLDTSDGFEEGLVTVVSAGDDTDTNGAVAGAVLGARYGAAAIPQRWLECVPERERLEAVVEALTASS